MARGTSLGELVAMFRDEAGLASTAALSQNTLEAIKTTLRRTQDILYEGWAWPHLRVDREEALQAGESQYSFPPDLNPDRIEYAVARESATDDWRPVCYGITPGMRNEYDSSQNERSDPVRAWQYFDDGQYEVWPMTEKQGCQFQFTGLRKLRPLRQDADLADLDDRLIVLFAAGQWLKRSKDPAADIVLQLADSHYLKVKGNSQRKTVFPIAAAIPTWTPITVKAPGT
ncbi:hypothetical protein [Pseudomonas sp. BF-R-21]|uniref:hypothetical protein n=1 Tax=Pseudomonas sp. BF-R-21 TaxID=2832387 RepID=UPI001CC17F71|nr:hypothetical protein [Pseudomonas sp. BF-R-21]